MRCKSCGNPSGRTAYLETEPVCPACLKMWLRAVLRCVGREAHKLATGPR
jgi:hypothetical protein